MILDSRQPPNHLAGYDPVATGTDCIYDEQSADRAADYFPKVLTFVRGPKAGEPFHLEPWQSDIVKTLFGWKRTDGTRRFRQVFIEVPRKNGKSTFTAALATFVLFCDAEAGAECYCAASDREQSSLVFNAAATMVRKSTLAKRCKIRDSTKRIIYNDSFLRAIPANEGGSHGFDSHLIIGDELHAWPGREFHDVLHTSTGARQQPLEIYITTAGYDRHSVCYEKYQYARQVRDGKLTDNAFLPVIYEAEETDDWTDPEVWRKANPNLGVSLSEEYLHRECERAKITPSYENTFRRFHLNQWTSQESRWLSMERWRACLTTEGDIADGSQVYGGLDLSSNVDVTAWMLVCKMDTGYQVRGHYFIPEATLVEAEKRDRVPYSAWVREGWVTATPGNSVNYQYVHQRILEDSERYEIGLVGYDPWNAVPTANFLELNGIECLKMRQGVATLCGPSKELERCVIEGVLDHGRDPVLEWMAENAQVKTDENGNIRPVKPDHHASAKRIDGIVAAIMAIGVAMATPDQAPSIYEQPGAMIL